MLSRQTGTTWLRESVSPLVDRSDVTHEGVPTLAISDGKGCNNIIKSSHLLRNPRWTLHALLLSLDVTFILLVHFRLALRRIVAACPHPLLAWIVVSSRKPIAVNVVREVYNTIRKTILSGGVKERSSHVVRDLDLPGPELSLPYFHLFNHRAPLMLLLENGTTRGRVRDVLGRRDKRAPCTDS